MENDAGSRLSLSIVVPVYDEEASVAPLYREICEAIGEGGESAEIIWVDDGSRDASRERLLEIAAKDERVRVLALDGNHGQSAALAAGFAYARGDWVVTLDGDLQNDPADIPRLLARRNGVDCVNGIRARRHDSLLRRGSSWVANRARNWITGDRDTDVGCSLRVMRRELLVGVHAFRGMHRFLPTLLRLEGARTVEVEVSHRPRRHGASKYGLHNRLWVGLVDLWAVRWMQRRALRYRVTECGGGPRTKR